MLNFQYLEDTNNYQVSFEKLNKNHVKILGDIPLKTSGFILTRINEPEAFTGDYSDYITVYKEIDGGVIFSNDGSVYVEPTPRVTFTSNGGGNLDGKTVQEVWNYEDLVIPEPIASEDCEFVYWSPEIPESGEIDGNKLYVAVFVSTLPEPEPEPTLEERVGVMEEDITKINEALGGV